MSPAAIASDPGELRSLVLAMSDAIDAAHILGAADARQAARDAYQRGYADGYARGTRQMQDEWPAVVAPLSGPSLAETEARRWELRGERRTRETFGQPHRADFRGGLPVPGEYPGRGGDPG